MRPVNQEHDMTFDKGTKSRIFTTENRVTYDSAVFINETQNRKASYLIIRYWMVTWYDILLNLEKIQTQDKEQWHY